MATKKFNHHRTFGVELECYLPRGHNREELAAHVTRTTGIELVVERYNHQTRGHWKVTTDASLGYSEGAEIVSPPLAGEAGLAQMRAVMEAMRTFGCRINRQCGLHVHHDVTDYGTQHFRNLASIYVKLERSIDSIMPPSRRGNMNGMLRSHRRSNQRVRELVMQYQRCETLRELISVMSCSRYVKLNFESVGRQGTVEFRQHSGTVEYEKADMWVRLTQGMVERAYERETIHPDRENAVETLGRMVRNKRAKEVLYERHRKFKEEG